MLRTIGGVIAGILVFMATLTLMEYLAHQVAPRNNQGLLYAIVALAYFLTSLLGGLTAAKISRQAWTVWLIALLATAGSIYSILTMPQPLWMQVASVVAPLLGGFVASRIVARSRTGLPA
jgi:MFS family permease